MTIQCGDKKMRNTRSSFVVFLFTICGTLVAPLRDGERLGLGATRLLSTRHGLSVNTFPERTRRQSRSLASEERELPVPTFSYRMTIIDKDLELDGFESHLIRITIAHLETALGAALSSSSTLRDMRVDNLQLGANLHRAFTGENPETGEPEALVRCSFSGSVFLSAHGEARDAVPTVEQEGQQRSEVDQIIEGALSNSDLLFQRFAADANLKVVEELSVNIHGPNHKRHKIDSSPSAHGDSAIQLTGVVLALSFIAFLAVLVIRHALRSLPPSSAASSKSAKRRDSEFCADDDTSLDKGIEALGRTTCEKLDDDETSQGSSRSSPVFL